MISLLTNGSGGDRMDPGYTQEFSGFGQTSDPNPLAWMISRADLREEAKQLRSPPKSAVLRVKGFRFHIVEVGENTDPASIPTERLYQTEGVTEPDSATVGLMAQCDELLRRLDKALEALDQNDQVQADIEYMVYRKNVSSLANYLEISDGIGLVISQLLKLSAHQALAHEAARLIKELVRTLRSVRNNPNLPFSSGMETVERLEEITGEIPLPGYDSLAAMLLNDTSTPAD